MKNEILLDDILVEDRLRIDHSNTDGLKESLAEKGTIQPLVLVENGDGRLRLLAGGRRITFLKELGHKVLYHGSTCDKDRPGFVFGKELPPDLLREYELEENLKRRDMVWQEVVMGIAESHSLRRMRGSIEGFEWGMRETAKLFGYKSHCQVSDAIYFARRLKDKTDPLNEKLWECDTINEAHEKVLEEEQNRAAAEIARRQAEAPVIEIEEEHPLLEEFEQADNLLSDPIPEGVSPEILALRNTPYDELTREQARLVYLSGALNKPELFDEYYEHKLRQIEAKLTINLSKMLVQGDSIAFMNDPMNEGRFNHIITDIPYGIDMDMLQQQNQGMDVSSTAEEHDVDYNLVLIRNFFMAAYKCTDDKAFVITWCDAMLFEWMHSIATKDAGFAVQRWPFHWIKPGGMNNAAQYNQTKATEIAIICRKPGATRVLNTGLNYEQCSKDELCDIIDHPFAKPFRLWERLATEVSIEGQTILEPFMGRGSGVISMLQLKRNVVGVELNEAHYNLARHNVANQYFLKINPKYKFI